MFNLSWTSVANRYVGSTKISSVVVKYSNYVSDGTSVDIIALTFVDTAVGNSWLWIYIQKFFVFQSIIQFGADVILAAYFWEVCVFNILTDFISSSYLIGFPIETERAWQLTEVWLVHHFKESTDCVVIVSLHNNTKSESVKKFLILWIRDRIGTIPSVTY